MTQQSDRLEGARSAAQRVLAALPRAAEGLDQLATGLENTDVQTFTTNVPGVEPVGISIQSVEKVADGFREVVKSLEKGKLGKELAATPETSEPAGVIESIEKAATSIQSFIASIEAEPTSDVDVDEVFKLGKLSGAAELIVGSLEATPV